MVFRRKTRQVMVGGVPVGGDAPVSIQSMTSTYTWDVDATVRQIRRLAEAGCDIVRVAVPEKRDTEALPFILEQSPVPIVADVHFHFERALEAVAADRHDVRLNAPRTPGHRVVDTMRNAGPRCSSVAPVHYSARMRERIVG